MLMRALLNELNFHEILLALKRKHGVANDNHIDWQRETSLPKLGDADDAEFWRA